MLRIFRLLARHYVERRHHSRDRRRVTGSITVDGQRVIDELEEKRQNLLGDLPVHAPSRRNNLLATVLLPYEPPGSSIPRWGRSNSIVPKWPAIVVSDAAASGETRCLIRSNIG